MDVTLPKRVIICDSDAPFSCLSSLVVVPSLSFCPPGCRAPHCSADDLDISQSLLKALESERDSLPWPSLHINMDKVRPPAAVRLCWELSRVFLGFFFHPPPALLSGRREAFV